MACFPLFVELCGRICACVGGGSVAARRARALLDFGAALRVIAPRPSEALLALAGQERFTLLSRPYAGPADIEGCALVIAASDSPEVNRAVARDAGAAGIPVNVADAPRLCSFFFPALVRRGELVAGISSSGACPGLAARLREDLEKHWPPGIGEGLERLKDERRRLREAGDSLETRRALDLLVSRLLAEEGGLR